MGKFEKKEWKKYWQVKYWLQAVRFICSIFKCILKIHFFILAYVILQVYITWRPIVWHNKILISWGWYLFKFYHYFMNASERKCVSLYSSVQSAIYSSTKLCLLIALFKYFLLNLTNLIMTKICLKMCPFYWYTGKLACFCHFPPYDILGVTVQ